MTWSAIKDVAAALGAVVAFISAVATGLAKIWMWYRKRQAPAPTLAAPTSGPACAAPEAPDERSLASHPGPAVLHVIPVAPSPTREQARAAVRAPALALLILAGVGFLANVFLAGFGFVDNFVTPLSDSSLLIASPSEHKAGADAPSAPSDDASIVLAIVFFLGMAAAAAAAFFGGLSMLTLKNHLVAAMGSIAIMPGACFCCMFGFPVSLWCMVVLMRPEVKAAFYS